MEKDNLATPTWNPSSFGMKMQSHELNCTPQQLPNSLYNANWDNSVDQSDPFESALSSIVSSPAASNAATTTTAIAAPGDGDMIRELIGRLGSICNSGEISSQSYIYGSNNNNSTNTSCYSTPLNSSPKLNLSLIDPQMRGNLPISHPRLAPFSADPAFVERAARFSCFGGGNFGGLNGQQFNLNEAELAYNRSMPRIDSGKLSRASSNQSLKLAAAGSQMGVQESNKSSPQDGNSAPDKKFSRFSRSSTPENAEFGDSREGSSVSEQIPGGDLSVKPENVTNSRKRKSGPRGKAKETPSSPSAKDGKVVAENEEPIAKRSKADEASGNEKETAKSKTEPNGGTQKQTKDNSESPEPPKDYIHVRARRGQATDSHSLAERVRREKISERMKFLQDLVPGCNKVTGKAVMLDEIINYVQSLQRQVEFLSMKLATVNPRMDLNMEALLSKEIFQSRGSLQNALYQLESAVPASFPFGYHPQQLPPLHNSSNISSGTETQFPANPLNAALGQNQLPAAFDRFGEATPQVPTTFFEDDLQSVVQMGFGQIQQQSLHGSMASAQMKIEL